MTYAGNPRFWLVSGQRLYLFGREENRERLRRATGALSLQRWPGWRNGRPWQRSDWSR